MSFLHQRFFRLYVVLIFVLLSKSSFGTVTYTWNKTTAGTFNWTDAANWNSSPSTPGGYPGSGGSTTDNAILSSTTVTQTITLPTGTLTLNSISCTGVSSHILTFTMTGCDLVISGTSADWVYSTLNSANSITVTASDHVKMDHSIFDNFPIALTCTNTTKSGGSVTTNQALYVNSSTFAGAFTSSSKTYMFSSNTFSGITSIEKKDFGATTQSTSTGNAGNTFNNQTTFLCNDNAANSGIYWGQAIGSTQDAFNGVTTFTNNSSNSFLINTTSGTVNFTNHAYFYNTSSGSISLANTSSCVVNFTGSSSSIINVYCSNTGTGGIYMSISGAVNFDYANVVFGNTSTGTTRIGSVAVSTAVNTLKATSTLNTYPDASSVPSTVPATPYFSNG
ncbi:MAG TPA: hypothetical protein VK750_06550, partial [Cytophagaceae bacterium]|nr:hypothetical protein [Cytophagaceae bacterium]